ncbi:MAG: sulfatase, partial [Verrucomicrobiota bacterium]
MKIYYKLMSITALSLAGCLTNPLTSHADTRPNVLFIAVDDLRSQLNCYGDTQMHTPNIDSLAAQGVLFRNHYVSNPICIPSRAAMLTGVRCERTNQAYGPSQWLDLEGVQTMGTTFTDAGYMTATLGKIWHTLGDVPKDREDKFELYWKGDASSYYADPKLSALREKLNSDNSAEIKGQLPAAEGPLDVPDNSYMDGQLADMCIKWIKDAAKDDRPFMFMAGFQKPHLPFNAPKKYWDLYDPDNPPAMPTLESLPEKASKKQLRNNHELWKYGDGFSKNNQPKGKDAKRLRQGYAACISFVDAQIGRILNQLDKSGLTDNTIIIFWSDHGYQLGHLGSWTKSTNLEMTAGAPLIISAPGFSKTFGRTSSKMVESVDLFPTMLDLCGLDPLVVGDGASLRPLLEDPANPGWNTPAWHVVKRSGDVGHAVRDERYRYVEWRTGWGNKKDLFDVELYDYEVHPEERINVANDPAYAGEVARLSKLLWNWEQKPGQIKDPPVDPVDPVQVQHLDASLVASVDGNPVTRWKDQSSNSNDAIANTGLISYPSEETFASGLSGLDFGSTASALQLFSAKDSDDWLDQSGKNPPGFSVLMAYKRVKKAGNSREDLIGNESNTKSGFLIRMTNGGIESYLDGEELSQNGSVAEGNSVVVGVNYHAGTELFELWDSQSGVTNGAIVPPADFSKNAPVLLGMTTKSNRYLNGLVGEVKIFYGSLDAKTFASEREALVQKWAKESDSGSGPGAAELVLHLNATDASSVEGNPVSQWSDLSGLGNHATPSKGAVTYPSLAFFPSGLKGLDFGSGRNTLEL